MLVLCVAAPSFSRGHVPGEVIAVFRDDVVSASGVEACAAEFGASVKNVYASLSGKGEGTFMLLRTEAGQEQELVEALKARPEVMSVSLNYTREGCASSYTPNDTYAEYLWGMRAIRANELWDNGTFGNGDVYVAVLDGGVDPNHEDLRGNVSNYSRNILTGGTSYTNDYHGTHIAGVIGAEGNNELGVAGVNWDVQIISVCIFDGDTTQDSAVIGGLDYVIELLDQGVNIAAVNMSIGGWEDVSPAQNISSPLYRAMLQVSRTDKAVMCVAAGNENQAVGIAAPCNSKPDEDGKYEYLKGDYTYPASYVGIENMIVVAAANNKLERDIDYAGSNYNADIAAPGGLILSCVPANYAIDDSERIAAGENKYAVFSGTSMAAPHVSGTVALMKAVYPEAKASQIRKAILDGADRNHCMNDSGAILYDDGLDHVDADTSDNGFLDSYTALRILPNIMATYNVDPPQEEEESGGGCNVLGGMIAASLLTPCIFLKRK